MPLDLNVIGSNMTVKHQPLENYVLISSAVNLSKGLVEQKQASTVVTGTKMAST